MLIKGEGYAYLGDKEYMQISVHLFIYLFWQDVDLLI